MTDEYLINFTKPDIRELITYDAFSGKAFHNERNVKWFENSKTRSAIHSCNWWNSKFAGKEITGLSDCEYIRFQILGRKVYLHRLIWIYMTGEVPNQIDHINGVRNDNRWCNLRNVTPQENMRNQRKYINNTSGCIGVFRDDNRGKWSVSIVNDLGKNVWLGYFISLEDATLARKEAEIKYGYSERHGNEL